MRGPYQDRSFEPTTTIWVQICEKEYPLRVWANASQIILNQTIVLPCGLTARVESSTNVIPKMHVYINIIGIRRDLQGAPGVSIKDLDF